ncbi:MAG: hypoxanthine phosphoribosyltransferase [Magnetococcales bacterium]|nr:hypoxanthine phosphoribosyltransferase [Magnetococcales bacterium]
MMAFIPPAYVSQDELADRVGALARALVPRLRCEPIVIGVMKGAFMFTADLVRQFHALGIAPRLDFITVSSYGFGAQRADAVAIVQDHSLEVNQAQVVLVEDIIDSGHTLKTLQSHFINKGVAELLTVVLLDKPSGRATSVLVDSVGFTVPDGFWVGYGLDYAGNYRGLPYIARIQP